MRGNRLYKALDGWLGRLGILALSALPESRDSRVMDGDFTRILVIKLSALGDTIILVPALRALRRRYPHAEIALVGTQVNEEIAFEYPQYIDRFFRLDVARAAREPWSLIHFIQELRAGRWQLGIDFDQWTHITPLILRLAGLPVRIGFRTGARLRHRLYTTTCPRLDAAHEAENFARLLEPLGIHHVPLELELTAAPEVAERARRHLRARGWDGEDPVVLVHPGTGAPGTMRAQRAWPSESYAELLCRMEAEGERFFLVVSAAPDERPIAESLLASQPAEGCVVTLPLKEFIGCLSLASVVISGNSGTMHLAAALGLPQIALHGPAGAGKWGPLNRRAIVIESGCPDCPCLDMGWEYHQTDGYCMRQIPLEAVLEPAIGLVRESRPMVARAAQR